MKVMELIEVLKKYPKDCSVTTHDYEPFILVYDEQFNEVDRIGVAP